MISIPVKNDAIIIMIEQDKDMLLLIWIGSLSEDWKGTTKILFRYF